MILGRNLLSGRATTGVVIFTVIETIILTAWLAYLFPGIVQSHNAGIAVVVLAVGLFAEHYVATVVGRDQ